MGGAITAALVLTAALSLVYTPQNPLEMSITDRLEAMPEMIDRLYRRLNND